MKKVVAFVDDDRKDLYIAEKASRKFSEVLDFRTFPDGDSLIDYVMNSNGDIPILVLLDLRMPEKNGHCVLQELRTVHNKKSIPIVIFTTSRDPSDVKKSYDYGANSYIVKPSSWEETKKTIETVIEYWTRYSVIPGDIERGSKHGGYDQDQDEKA